MRRDLLAHYRRADQYCAFAPRYRLTDTIPDHRRGMHASRVGSIWDTIVSAGSLPIGGAAPAFGSESEVVN